MLSPTLTNQGPTLTSKSGPSVTPMLVQSRLLLLGVCHRGEAKAAPPNGRLHQSWLRWACHPVVLSLSDTENYWGFQGYSPFHEYPCKCTMSPAHGSAHAHAHSPDIFPRHHVTHCPLSLGLRIGYPFQGGGACDPL